MIDRRMLVVVALVAGVAACHGRGDSEARDAGPDVTRHYSVGNFDKLVSAGPYDVTVVSGGQPGQIDGVGGSNLLDQTEVVIDDGALQIRPKEHHGISWPWDWHSGWSTDGHARFTVHAGPLKEATMAGSGNLAIDKVVGEFEGTIAGSGNIDLAAVDATKIKLTIAGSGNTKAAGKAVSGEYSIAGSGDMVLTGLQAETIEATVAGSGSIAAHASKSAEINIMGSGDVDVAGGGKCTVQKAGAGTANCH